MRPSITFVIAVLITFGGTGAALSNCPKNLSAAGDVFRLQAHGLIGDQLDPMGILRKGGRIPTGRLRSTIPTRTARLRSDLARTREYQS